MSAKKSFKKKRENPTITQHFKLNRVRITNNEIIAKNLANKGWSEEAINDYLQAIDED